MVDYTRLNSPVSECADMDYEQIRDAALKHLREKVVFENPTPIEWLIWTSSDKESADAR